MNKLVIVVLAAVVVLATAEPPSSYGAPSAPIYSIDESTNEGAVVDQALLARIAQILSENSSGGYSSGSSSGYSAPTNSYRPPTNSYSAPSSGYGAPSRSSGGVQLGQPERAQLISEFEISGESGGYGGPSRGGY